MAMTTWKARIVKKSNKGSRTPGRTKGESCQADAFKKVMAKRSRSYKTAGYSEWNRKTLAMNARAGV